MHHAVAWLCKLVAQSQISLSLDDFQRLVRVTKNGDAVALRSNSTDDDRLLI